MTKRIMVHNYNIIFITQMSFDIFIVNSFMQFPIFVIFFMITSFNINMLFQFAKLMIQVFHYFNLELLFFLWIFAQNNWNILPNM
jgi:hypothetical protein